ncbi:MAG TPA: hypothetical protein VH877_09890 [Polyangia bacterium]|jgi:hypothetical protein|nr:hypothetical protein [Polyangia bacterium]
MMRRAALLLLLFVPLEAAAYVRSTTENGTPIYWDGNCAFIIPDTVPSPELTLDEVLGGLTRSMANWQTATSSCSYFRLNQDTPAAGEAKLDRKNVLKFRNDRWCRPAEKNTPEMCYSAGAAAITTVFYSTDQKTLGRIVDADIEFNAINFTFVNVPSSQQARPGTLSADLENTLTHELGHFQGLDHTCWDGSTANPPRDETGNTIPSCGNLGSLPQAERDRITMATMYNYAGPNEIIKRTPEQDDINGICAIYPLARDPGQCLRPDRAQSGCSVALGTAMGRSAASGALVLGLLVCLGLGLAFRRRRTA